MDNGHRANILGGSNLLGVGRYSSTYTQDFGRGTVPTGLVAGVHYPQTGSSVALRTNWYAAAGPQTAMVSVEGTCHPLSLERGTETNGTYLASVSGLPTTCQRYVFHFTDAAGADVFYPSSGAYGIGCSSDWLDTRPAPCGPCTPDCTGKACGDDGCGGSCGSCPATYGCDAAGQCVCAPGLSECGAVCADTLTDLTNCGTCGHRCADGILCAAGLCQVPDAALPDAALPDAALPDTAQPDTAQPDTAQPDAAQPDAAQPDAAQPDTAQPDTAQPDAAQPDAAQPDAAQPDAAQPDTAQPDTTQPDTTQPDTTRLDAAQLDAALPDTAQSDAAYPDTAATDLPRFDAGEPDGEADDGARQDTGVLERALVDGYVVVADAALDATGVDALQRVNLGAAGCDCRSQQPATPAILLLGLVLLAARRRCG